MTNLVPPDSAKESAAALLAWANENEIVELDARFVDVRGIAQHFSLPLSTVSADDFEAGFGFDGSSIQGFQAINESDMILMADLSTAKVDPFYKYPTLAIKCDVYEPIGRTAYANDPRRPQLRALRLDPEGRGSRQPRSEIHPGTCSL
jgi:glutamine synthetase